MIVGIMGIVCVIGAPVKYYDVLGEYTKELNMEVLLVLDIHVFAKEKGRVTVMMSVKSRMFRPVTGDYNKCCFCKQKLLGLMFFGVFVL